MCIGIFLGIFKAKAGDDGAILKSNFYENELLAIGWLRGTGNEKGKIQGAFAQRFSLATTSEGHLGLESNF